MKVVKYLLVNIPFDPKFGISYICRWFVQTVFMRSVESLYSRAAKVSSRLINFSILTIKSYDLKYLCELESVLKTSWVFCESGDQVGTFIKKTDVTHIILLSL